MQTLITLVVAASLAGSSFAADLTEEQQAAIRQEVIDAMQRMFAAEERLDTNAVWAYHADVPDYLWSDETGKLHDFAATKKAWADYLAGCAKLKTTTKREQVLAFDPDVALYLWHGSVEGTQKDGTAFRNDPWTARYLCRRFGGDWKIIGGQESTAPSQPVTPNQGKVDGDAAAVQQSASERVLNAIADDYVKLLLAVGQHDPDYVDAYYGPPEWKQQAERSKRSLAELAASAQELGEKLRAVDASTLHGLLHLRYNFLRTQVGSVDGRISLLMGRKLPFDEESKLLYDAVLPEFPAGHFEAIRAKLDKLLPGQGPLPDRIERFENRFIVPKDKVEAVMRAAIAECRRRTRAHFELPEKEDFKLELVTGQPWDAYNRYKGGAQSVIQINLDLPFRMTQVIRLSAHEGYPGHHVYNILLERELVRKRGWTEFQVYALFSPQSVVSEGSADFGIEVVFPMAERVKFAREVLFPLAGLDPAGAALYFEVFHLPEFELAPVESHIQRRFLDGGLEREEALRLLSAEALIPRARAEKSLEFAQHYRAYLTTYPAGYRLVKHYVEARGGGVTNAARRWEVFRDLLSSPMTPADLR